MVLTVPGWKLNSRVSQKKKNYFNEAIIFYFNCPSDM